MSKPVVPNVWVIEWYSKSRDHWIPGEVGLDLRNIQRNMKKARTTCPLDKFRIVKYVRFDVQGESWAVT